MSSFNQIKPNFLEYYKSINEEFEILENRVRQLIGGSHWQTDGEYKESVLRKILRNHLPEVFHVGRGAVCCKQNTSRQIDILITDRNKPTLFKDGDLVFVTPDAVKAVIEVKTDQYYPNNFLDTFTKLAEEAEKIRQYRPFCKIGVFIYNDSQTEDESILKALQQASSGKKKRAINWITIGADRFIRFWDKGKDVNSAVNGPVWHLYNLTDLARAYFVSNVVWDVSEDGPEKMKFAWFPIRGGKELYRKCYMSLNGEYNIFDNGWGRDSL